MPQKKPQAGQLLDSTWSHRAWHWRHLEDAERGVRVQAGVLTVANASAASCGLMGWIQKRVVAFVFYPLPQQQLLPSPQGLEIKPRRVNQHTQDIAIAPPPSRDESPRAQLKGLPSGLERPKFPAELPSSRDSSSPALERCIKRLHSPAWQVPAQSQVKITHFSPEFSMQSHNYVFCLPNTLKNSQVCQDFK